MEEKYYWLIGWLIPGLFVLVGLFNDFKRDLKKGRSNLLAHFGGVFVVLLFGPLVIFPALIDKDLENPLTKEHLTYLALFSPILSLLLLWFM